MDFIELLLLAIGQMFSTLGGRPSGKYEDAGKTTSIEFKSRKVFVRFTQAQGLISCAAEGDNVSVKFKDGERLFTFDSKANEFTGPNGIRLAHVPNAAKSKATDESGPASSKVA